MWPKAIVRQVRREDGVIETRRGVVCTHVLQVLFLVLDVAAYMKPKSEMPARVDVKGGDKRVIVSYC